MSVSVRTRFEVFKRDRFTCSYCGRTPPEVLLEVDHIVPRAAGGTDEITNLTTACATCNRGKSARLLEEGTAPVVGRATVEELAERVEQAKAYMELLGGMQNVTERQIQMVKEHWARVFKAKVVEESDGSYWTFDEGWGERWPNEHSLRRFLRTLTLEDVLAAVDIAAERRHGFVDQNTTHYFYGICNRAIRDGSPVTGTKPRKAITEADVDDARAEGYQEGRDAVLSELRALFANPVGHGYESIADVIRAMWPEDE